MIVQPVVSATTRWQLLFRQIVRLFSKAKGLAMPCPLLSVGKACQLVPEGTKPRTRALMAIKKSDLYASHWASCDELRGGMDASQYKDCCWLFAASVDDQVRLGKWSYRPGVVIGKSA